MFTTRLYKLSRLATPVPIRQLWILSALQRNNIPKVFCLLSVLCLLCLDLNGNPSFSPIDKNICCLEATEETITPTKHQKVKTIRVTHVASQKEYADLLVFFRKVGVNVTNNSKIKKKQDWLKEIKFQLSHPRGLNFKLRVTGFQILEFQFFLDEQDQLQHFTYRINDEEVYQQINPTTKGYKTYVCFDTGIVQEGETNDSIERYH